jgi:hypothetical protein
MPASLPVEVDPSEVADEKLEAGVRSESRLGELDPELPVDSLGQICFFLLTESGLSLRLKVELDTPFKPRRKAFPQDPSSRILQTIG